MFVSSVLTKTVLIEYILLLFNIFKHNILYLEYLNLPPPNWKILRIPPLDYHTFLHVASDRML